MKGKKKKEEEKGGGNGRRKIAKMLGGEISENCNDIIVKSHQSQKGRATTICFGRNLAS